jgi:ABC-type transport system involved in cytochrome c biogenesis permease subunit
VLWVLGSWVLTLEPVPSHFPATYYNEWKWVHVFLGKVYLALLLIGVGLGGVMILRRFTRTERWFRAMPADDVVDRLAWRVMILALVFDSLMLIAGAVWAQDAWGRYWQWDALETSAFATWLALALGIHLRLTYRIPPWISGAMIIGVFILAFTTYFGMPYLSPAAHKGMV